MKLKTITTIKFTEVHDTIKFTEVHDTKDLKDECKNMSTEQLKNYIWKLRKDLAEDIRKELACDKVEVEVEVLTIDVEGVEK